jgi:hypothetical protein
MTRAVVILGAGSSADFGVPVLARMFLDSHSHKYLGMNPDLFEMLNDIFWRPRGYSIDTSDQSLNIEQMLTIIRDWEKEEGVQEKDKPQAVIRFKKGLYVLIQKAVFEGKSTNAGHLNPLIDMCRKNFEHTTWVSFNWDCIFESSFWYSQPYNGPGSRVNPRLVIDIADWRQGPANHTYLKLHGGINWWLIDNRITYLRWTGHGSLRGKWNEYDTVSNFKDMPVILEPSYYKYQTSEYNVLARQWDVFLEDLLQADCIVIVGYSLPEMDINARQKILTSFQVNQDAKWLIIDPSDSAYALYHKLLGTKRVTFRQETLTSFNNDILNHFQNAFPSIDFTV